MQLEGGNNNQNQTAEVEEPFKQQSWLPEDIAGL